MKTARTCGKCGETKVLSEFPNSKNASSWCRACCRDNAAKWRTEHPDETLAADRARAGRNQTPDARRAQLLYRLLKKYGLTIEEYEALYEAQDGVCAICKCPPEEAGRWERLMVDHDHETQEVRGLLCQNCNSGLGHFRDDPELLRRAVLYLLGETAVLTAGGFTSG